jgi:tubulin polyglutamylase TTLL1
MFDVNLVLVSTQVNASPSLTTTTTEDRSMKSRLLRDVLELAVINDSVDSGRSTQTPVLKETNGFRWLVNEANAADRSREQRKNTKRLTSQWR